jgi:hypothetical protein
MGIDAMQEAWRAMTGRRGQQHFEKNEGSAKNKRFFLMQPDR